MKRPLRVIVTNSIPQNAGEAIVFLAEVLWKIAKDVLLMYILWKVANILWVTS